MPIVTDLVVVRGMLNRDRAWAAYAIGDLAPGLVEHCEWRVSPDGTSALTLVYRGFNPPIAFAMGDAQSLSGLFGEFTDPGISLHVRPETLDVLSSFYTIRHTHPMRRMTLHHDAFAPASHAEVRRLGSEHLAAILALYEDGHRRGEGPAFFYPAMLQQGTFRGLWEGGQLVAIAGSHLYSPAEGVCAIGNVYTRSDRRGRGLAARVTSAVVAHAIAVGVTTIVLNVGKNNVAAQRVYERLGFHHYCDFVEGEAHKRA
jgi:ribosomal protein S18 acetylase RimI-like enzyme